MNKILKEISDDDLIELLSKANSDDEIQKILLNSGRDLSNVQALNSDILGSLIEKRFGTEDVKSSESLNNYLTKMKQKDYPALDEIKKIIYPNAKDVNASYGSGFFNNGLFYSDPTMDIPIRLGSTPITNKDYTNARAKRVLAHELSHANDLPAIHLKRIEIADPEKYKELTERIGNINKGGEQFLQHSKNIANIYPTESADMLTPDKVDILEKLLKEQPPSGSREDHLSLINKYKKALLRDRPNAIDKQMIEKYIGIDRKKIPDMPAENLRYTPDRDYITKVLESEYNPIKAEAIRSQGHHSIRKDILEDIGHYEGRNIKRLSKGMGLLSKLPLIGPTIGAGIAAMSGEANAASAVPILGESESLGPEKGSEDYSIENPQASPEIRRKALESLLRK